MLDGTKARTVTGGGEVVLRRCGQVGGELFGGFTPHSLGR